MVLLEKGDHIFITANGSHTTMKSKPIGTLFGVLTLVTIVTIAPHAFAQYQYPDQSTTPSTSTNSTASSTTTNSTGNTINTQSMGSMTMEQAMSSDGSEMVTIDTSPAAPTSGQPLMISLNFTDASGSNIHHQNYNIALIQDGKTIFSNATGHTHTGLDTQATAALTSADPVDVQVTLTGVGLPGTDPSTWTGPKGDVVSFHVVPEFGSIAPIILAIAVISIVVLTAKTRGIPKL